MFAITGLRRSFDPRPRGPYALNEDSPQAQGLAAWYPLGDQLFGRDHAKLGKYSLTTRVGSTLSVEARSDLGLCHDFTNAGGDGLQVAAAAVTEFPVSISAWFRRTTNVVENRTIASLGRTSGAAHYWSLAINNTAIRAIAASTNGGASVTTAGGPNPSPGEWTLGIAVFESATLRRAGQNGHFGADGTVSRVLPAVDMFSIGVGISSGLTLAPDGSIADVRVYNRVIGPDEYHAMSYADRWDLYYPIGRKTYLFPLPPPPPNEGSGTCNGILGGVAEGHATHEGSGTCTGVLSGSAEGLSDHAGSGECSGVLSGTATGHADHAGSGACDAIIGGLAVGFTTRSGAGTCSGVLSGLAVGMHPPPEPAEICLCDFSISPVIDVAGFDVKPVIALTDFDIDPPCDC